MRTIISISILSEATFSPKICGKAYDNKLDKFIRVSYIPSMNLIQDIKAGHTKIEDIIDDFKIDSIIPDEEIIELYNDTKAYVSLTMISSFDKKAMNVIENYVKHLNREDKLNNLGI